MALPDLSFAQVQALVEVALRNAETNGYGPDLRRMSALGVVNDLKSYDAACEDVAADKLMPHVVEWLRKGTLP